MEFATSDVRDSFVTTRETEGDVDDDGGSAMALDNGDGVTDTAILLLLLVAVVVLLLLLLLPVRGEGVARELILSLKMLPP